MQRARPSGKRSRCRPTCMLITGLALALAGVWPALTAEERVTRERPAEADAAPAEITIVSTEFKFVPSRMQLPVGRKVLLILDNSSGETEHGVFLPALNARLEAKAGETAKGEFVFEKPGFYDFVCDLPGHRDAGMQGMIEVSTSLAAR